MSRKPSILLPAGTQAPDFSLRDAPENWVALSDYAGSPVVLLFYAADFHPVCTRQLTVFNEALPAFHRLGAQVLGISNDNVWSHIAFSEQFNMHFPLLSDFYPIGEASSAYRVPTTDGESARAAFVVDARGDVAWSHIAPPDIALDAKGALETVEKL